jgi:hypothetical protein
MPGEGAQDPPTDHELDQQMNDMCFGSFVFCKQKFKDYSRDIQRLFHFVSKSH